MATSRQEQLRQELDRRKALQSELALRKQGVSGQINETSSTEQQPPERTPMDAIRDVAGGGARGIQNIATGLLEGGEYLTRKGAERLGKDLGHPVNVPEWNAREFMGLEGNRQLDPRKLLQGKNPDEISQMIGEYLPSMLAGGASIPGQIGAAGLYGAASSPKGEKFKTGLTDALIASLLPAGAKYIPKIINYFHPEKEARQFLKGLHGGTSQENVETLAKRIENANRSGQKESLIPKETLMAEHGGERVVPRVQVTQPDVDKISSIFSDDVSPEQAKKMTEAVKKYYDTGDIGELSEKGEEIFGHEGLSQKQLDRLESLLPFEKKRIPTGSYLKIADINKAYSANGELRDLHAAFSRNPTLERADELKSAIGKEKRFYERQEENGTIRDPGRKKLELLEKAENAVQKDIDSFASKLPPEKRHLYDEFRKKWAINAEKYSSKKNPAIREAARGNIGELNEGSLINEFKGPLSQRVEGVLQDIGTSGEGNILYSGLADLKPGDIEGLGERLTKLKQTGGMQEIYKPEHEALQKALMRRLQQRRYGLAGGLAGAGLLSAESGHPYAGSAIAATAIPAALGKKALAKILAKLL